MAHRAKGKAPHRNGATSAKSRVSKARAAARPRGHDRAASSDRRSGPEPPSHGPLDFNKPVHTGRHIVVFRPGQTAAAERLLKKTAGLRLANVGDSKAHMLTAAETAGAHGLVLPKLGVAVLSL